MKKVLFATLFALSAFGFTACDSSTSSTEGSTDTTTLAPAETTTPADTASMSADTTAAQ